MQRIRFTIFITLLSALSAPAFGKSTTQLDNGDFLTVIDATAGGAFSTEPHDFTYFSFEDQDVVALTDAEAAESIGRVAHRLQAQQYPAQRRHQRPRQRQGL